MPDGIVTGVGSRSIRVQVRDVGELRATLRGNLWAADRGETRPVAVGDRVEVTIDGEDAVVESVHERTNSFARPQPFGRFSGRGRPGKHGHTPPVQVIAANVDRILVVAALDDPPFRPGLVDRFCVAAAAQGLNVMIVLNKVDLPGDRTCIEPWREAGFRVFVTSADTGEGIDELRSEMSDGVTLLVGHSGVGKSSVLNAVDPSRRERVGHVNVNHGRGRHTTTKVSLLPLACGGFVVDTPGIREMALAEVSPAELARLFPGFDELPHHCKFNNCVHVTEPGCAVMAAEEGGELDPDRYDTYLRILEDLQSRGERGGFPG